MRLKIIVVVSVVEVVAGKVVVMVVKVVVKARVVVAMVVRVVLEVVVVGIACWLEEGAAVLVSLKVWEGKVVGWGKQVVRHCKNEK